MRHALIALSTLLLLVAGCGGVENEPNLAKAVERTEATGSASFELKVAETQSGGAFQAGCEGAADYTGDRFRIACDDGQNGKWELLELGNVAYIRSPPGFGLATGHWSKLPARDHLVRVFSPEKLLAMLRGATRASERIGDEDVRGEPTARYRLTIDCEGPDVSCTGETGTADVWIDSYGLVRRIVFDDGDELATIEFFDFGVEVDIEAPPADQVAELGEGWTGYGPSQDPNAAPCSEREAAPISESRALDALHGHGFSVRTDRSGYCITGVAAVITNAEPGDALEREGIVHCFLRERPEDRAPNSVVRRGVDGGDAELLLANLTCSILADSPNAEEKIRPLEQAFEELERAIRP